jgi:hypothetical protein
MARYGFTSPGASAQSALQAFLLQQAEQDRQRMLDDLTRQQTEAGIRRGEEQIRLSSSEQGLQRQRERRIDADADANRASLQGERDFRRAGVIASSALPDDPIDADTRALLEAQGFGGQVRTVPGVLSQGQHLGVDETGVDQYAVNQAPERYAMRGGQSYLNARAAEEARAAQAAAAQQAAAERAGDTNQTRMLIAGMAAQGAAASRGMQNELTGLKIDAERQKQADAASAKTRAADGARQSAQSTVDLIKQLVDVGPNGEVTLNSAAQGLFGARVPFLGMIPGDPSGRAKADAALNQLRGRTVIDMLNQMKQQSRTGATGFGALTERELALLERAATQLNNTTMSDADAAAELGRLYQAAVKASGSGATAGASPASPRTPQRVGRFEVVVSED